METLTRTDPLLVAGVELRSRLFLGTGKYATDELMLRSLEASGCEVVTVTLRRVELDAPKKHTIFDAIDWTRYRVLPNTAGCKTAEDALRIARLARSMGLSDWVKLEIMPDPRYLLPDPEDGHRLNRLVQANGGNVRNVECGFKSRSGVAFTLSVSISEFVVNDRALRVVVGADLTPLRAA